MNYNKNNREINSIKSWMISLKNEGYTLYEMTITYKPSSKGNHSIKFINKTFVNFYYNSFLQKYIFKKRNWHKKYNLYQPYLICFPEAHTPKYENGKFSDRFHHHAVVAVHPSNIEKFNSIVGKNTINVFSKYIMTSSLHPADENWVTYAAKDYKSHESEWLFFGPKSNN